MSNQIVPASRGALVVPSTVEALEDSPRRLIIGGIVVASLFFVLFLGWAALARLDASAVGTGHVQVAGNRQTVQHRDGGLVSELPVREGQHVKGGQILLRLAGSEVQAQERALTAAVINLDAQRARLEAELSGKPIVWPGSFDQSRPEDADLIARAEAMQERQFAIRRSSLDATRQVMQMQQASIAEQSRGYKAQTDAAIRQRISVEEQLEGTREIAAKGFVSKNYVRQLERNIAQLDGSAADYTARIAAGREQIGEAQKQYLQTERRWSEDAASLLRDTQAQLNDQRPKLDAAREQLERLLVRAPVSGHVVGLKIFTVGGVIRGGDPLMDIVPDSAPLVVRVSFDPSDIDGVYEGSAAEVKFGSLHERDLPILLGKVRTLSADTLTDDKSGRSYFTADVVVPESEIAKLRAVRGADTGIRPGIPVQVFVGLKKRTALNYLLDPLTEMLTRSFHER